MVMNRLVNFNRLYVNSNKNHRHFSNTNKKSSKMPQLSQSTRNGLTAAILVSFVIGVYYTSIRKMMQNVSLYYTGSFSCQ